MKDDNLNIEYYKTKYNINELAQKYIKKHAEYPYNMVYLGENGTLLSEDTYRDIEQKEKHLKRNNK